MTYKHAGIVLSYIFLTTAAKGSKRSRRWAVMKNHDEMLLYKNHEIYYKDPDKCKKVNMKGMIIKEHKEWDHQSGYYIMMELSEEGKFEIWFDNLKEYELWLKFLLNKFE